MVNISKRFAVCTPTFKLEALVGNHPVFEKKCSQQALAQSESEVRVPCAGWTCTLACWVKLFELNKYSIKTSTSNVPKIIQTCCPKLVPPEL
jgi:hypothetical protein